MVVHWRRERGPNWRRSAVVNGVGAVATGIVTLVIAVTKFMHGAWLMLILIPLLIVGFRAIHQHYARAEEELAVQTPLDPRAIVHTIVVPIAKLNRVALQTLAYARSLSADVVAVHVAEGRGGGRQDAAEWEALDSARSW